MIITGYLFEARETSYWYLFLQIVNSRPLVSRDYFDHRAINSARDNEY